MSYQIENLRIVILDSVYETWHHPQVPELFSSIIGLKLKGYGCEYPEGVLPVDTTDFMTTHLSVCLEEDGKLRPILSMKSTTLEKCNFHKMPFPALSLVNQAKAHPHVEVMEEFVRKANETNTGMTYIGAWTIDPEFRKNRILARPLRECFHTIYVNHHRNRNIDWIVAGGTMRFKVHELIEWMGHKPLEKDGEILSPIKVAHLEQELVRVSVLQEFTPEAIEASKVQQKLWENRIEFRADNAEQIREKLRLVG